MSRDERMAEVSHEQELHIDALGLSNYRVQSIGAPGDYSLRLMHTPTGTVICDIEHDDTLDVLVRTAIATDTRTLSERVAEGLLADTDLMTPNHDGTPEHYIVEADNVVHLVAMILSLVGEHDG